MNPDFLHGVTPGDVTYDIETYVNIFTVRISHRVTGRRWLFEISTRRDDTEIFCSFLDTLAANSCRMIGYNNIGFDYPVIHYIHRNRHCHLSVADIYTKAMKIIDTPFNNRFVNMVWESDWIVEQIDLYKIHNFDSVVKATSLKMLEFNMRMDSIEDLPFPVGTTLTHEQMDVLISYMDHDVEATELFADETMDMLAFRESLTAKYGKNFTNFNDTKIGSEIFIRELEDAGVDCFHQVDGKKRPRQTPRPRIKLADVILPYIAFEQPEFQRILDWFKAQTITETKGVFKNLTCEIEGLEYVFGTGGLHASVGPQVVYSTETHAIIDADVSSMYPSLAIKNNLYPEHLGQKFCDVYERMYIQRMSHAKGTTENAGLKLSLNSTYGNSNNEYSPFYDPQFTMAITLGGQLSLCMLAEQLIKIPGSRVLSCNTDGVCCVVPREYEDHYYSVCKWWEGVTKLTLEYDKFSMMAIRDVNSFVGVYEDET